MDRHSLLDDGLIPVLGLLVDGGDDFEQRTLRPVALLRRPDLAEIGGLADVGSGGLLMSKTAGLSSVSGGGARTTPSSPVWKSKGLQIL